MRPEEKILAGRILFVVSLLIMTLWSNLSNAMPAFARQYNMSCAACHDAFPRLNAFGESFAVNNFRLANWRETMLDLGDSSLALPRTLPLAIRVQGFLQSRDSERIDVLTGDSVSDSDFDIQAPYLVKLLSSAPLPENISYYFYGIFSEKGGNGEVIIEDVWFSYSDLAGSGISGMLGQFQVSDLMFPREVRLTFQDFYAYRADGITYERGIILDRAFGPLDLAIGAVNGNGIEQNFAINSPGYRRPDRLFDNDSDKSGFLRIGSRLGPVNIGLFGLVGEQNSVTGLAGTATGNRTTDKNILGIDLAGDITPQIHWFAQGLWSSWDGGFIETLPDQDYDCFGGFAGIDYILNERWAFSLLYNYAEADDFSNTGTIYEGTKINSFTVAGAYYFMRNVKAVLELNLDALGEDRDGPPFVGYQSKENYLLFGIDIAY
jgi:hypothetical protein